jgi:phage baseplate assembly protein W
MNNKQYKQKSFLGTGWNFPPSFSNKGGTAKMVDDEEDIHQSLMILLSTIPGERVHRPKFGCGIHKMVYEKINSSTVTLFKHTIEKSIILFETRIQVNNIEIDFSKEAEGTLYINIDYTIRLTNTRSNMVYPFYFREGTNLKLNA